MDGSLKSMGHSLWEGVCAPLPLLWDTHTLTHVVIMTFYARIWDSVSETVCSFHSPKSGAFGWLDSVSRILNCLLLLRSIGYQLVRLKCFQKLSFSLLVHCFYWLLPWSCCFYSTLFQAHPWQAPKLSPLNHIRSLKMFRGPRSPWQGRQGPSHSGWIHLPHFISCWPLFCNTLTSPLSYSALFQL